MGFEKRREFMGIYSVKNANPNGDPLRGNEPRMDDETGHVLVSDVRIKRTIRDEWDRRGEKIFVKLFENAKSLKERYLEPDIGGTEADSRDTAKARLRDCIDVRLFGVTFAPKGMDDKVAFSWTGPVQISWGESLHRVEPKLVQGTAAFASGDGKSQRSLRTEWIVPYAMIAFYGVANQYASQTTGATENDLDSLRTAWWYGTKNLLTRSKIEHKPLLWLEIVYRQDYSGLIGNLTGLVKLVKSDGSELTEDDELAIRSHTDVIIDLSLLSQRIVKDYLQYIDKIVLLKEPTLNVKGLEKLGDLVEVLEV